MKNSGKWWVRTALGITAAALSVAGAWGFTFILNDNTGLPVKWPAGTVHLRIMLGTSQNLSDGSSFNTSAAEAANIWNTHMGSIQFTNTQAAPAPASQSNSVNELVFAANAFGKDFDDDVLAITTGYYAGNERRPSDIVFNSEYTWDSYRGSRRAETVDLRRVALHELGHLLGLDHPDEADQTVAAIMNSRVGNRDTVADDDIQGIQSIYGPPGAPANNNFANATAITHPNGSLTVTGYNTNATKEPGEPNHADNSGGRSVWWRWTPGSAGEVTIDTKGSYFDTTLAIYTGSSLSSLTSVASDDDINDGIVQASTVTFQANASATYMIAVDGFNGDSSGADNAAIKLNLNFASLSPTNVPIITAQPVPATVDVGGSATFSVTATSSVPLSYQWLLNGAAVSGATSASYALSNIQQSQSGNIYSVTVSNSAGSVTSTGVSLIVRMPTTPPPPSGGGGGGGGGGGAPSLWFCAALAALGLGRLRQCRQR